MTFLLWTLIAFLLTLASMPVGAQLDCLQLFVASEESRAENNLQQMTNQTVCCSLDDPCQSLVSALDQARQIVHNYKNTTKQMQVELVLLNGTHVIPYELPVSDISPNISLVGMDENTTYLTCSPTSNSSQKTNSYITFTSFQEVSLKNLTIIGCKGYGVAVTGGAVFEMNKVVYVSISHCHFCNNSGVAVLLHDVTFVDILCTTFNSSTHVSNVSAGVHAVYSGLKNAGMTNSTLSVQSCHFESLTYLPNIEKSSDSRITEVFGLGAGLNVVLNDSQGNIQLDVAINNSLFVSNTANSGAGIYFRFDVDHLSRAFNIFLDNCHFYKCNAHSLKSVDEAGHGGGLVLLLFGKSRGVMEVVRSQFVSNSATVGAAMAVLYFDETLFSNVTVDTSMFLNNRATSLAAMAFLSFLSTNQWSKEVTLRNVTLENNSVQNEGSGSALATIHMDVRLEGMVKIARNNGTAVITQNKGWIIVMDSVTFDGNTGHNGGALRMINSQLVLYNSAHVMFSNNTATNEGGAIWVAVSNLVGVESLFGQHLRNHFCFIRSRFAHRSTSLNITDYSPKGSVTFMNNRAERAGGAVYTDTIDSCSWSRETGSYRAGAVLNLSNFLYINNSRPSISTAVAHLTAILRYTKSHNFLFCKRSGNVYCVIPGISHKLSVITVDKMQNPVSTTVVVSADKSPHAVQVVNHHDEMTNQCPNQTEKFFSFITDYVSGTGEATVYFCGPLQGVGEITVQSVADNVVTAHIPVKIQECVPGFQYEQKYQACTCVRKAHVYDCTHSGFIQPNPGYWIGQVQKYNESLVTTSFWCPPTYCSCPNGSCKFDARGDLDRQCADGRKGTLCGHCKRNYSATYGAIYPACLPCSDEVLWIMPLLTIIAVSAVAFAVLINFNASSVEVRSVAFYFQVVALTLGTIPPHGILQYRWISDLAWIPTLNIRVDACLLDNMTTLQSTLFLYYVPGCVFVFMAFGIFLARKFARVARVHVLRPFWSIVVLTYICISYTTALILNCVDIGDGELRWFPDATVKCYDGAHRNAAIAAFFIAGLYVVPLPLFLAFAAPRICKMKPICDIFLDAIKPSYRWAEGWYFFRRLLLVVVHCFSVEPFVRHTLITSLLCIFLAIHAQVQPYSGVWGNRLETALILNLCIISAFQMYFSSGPVPVEITAVFFLIPYVAVLLYIIYSIVQKIRHRLEEQNSPRVHALGDDIAKGIANHQNAEELELVTASNSMSEKKPRLSPSFQGNESIDVMDDSKPFLREPLLQQTWTSKPE
jgi:predicted outer membrane repeat protein